MDTSLILYLNNEWVTVDLYDDIPISLVIQEADITNLQARKSPYSKTFTVPGTSNNCRVFEEYYEVNGIDFNPLVKIDAVVTYRGTDIFNGICRLNSVTIKPTGIDFEIYLMGQTADFVSEIKDFNLQDYDWVDLQHELSYDNLVESWKAKNDETSGLFGGKILYPMVNYGLPYQDGSTTPAFSYEFTGSTGFYQIGRAIQPNVFKPAIRIKTIIDKIFENTTYTIQSEFFNTDYFKSIYMDTFQDGNVGTTSASGVTNQNIFKVYMRSSTILRPSALGTQNMRWWNLGNDGYNPLSLFKLAPAPPNPNVSGINPAPPAQNESYFRVPFAGTYYFNVKMTFSGEGNIPGDFVAGQFFARKGPSLASIDSGGNFAATSPIFSNSAPNGAALNWFFSGTCQSGDYVKVVWNTAQSSNSGVAQIVFRGFNSGGVTTPAPVWELYNSPTVNSPALVDFQKGMPNIKSIDFFKAMVTMFNLVVIQDEVNKTLKIEPYNWYYNDDDRRKVDYTQILDLNSSYKVEPLSFDLSKELNWTYNIVQGDTVQIDSQLSGQNGAVSDYYNTLFAAQNGYTFGNFTYTSTGNLLTGEQTYQLPFSSLPTETVSGSTYVIIPGVYQFNAQRQQLPFASKPHIFFWVGNRYAYTDNSKSSGSQWWLLSGATPFAWTTIPTVNHLSSLDITIPQYISDLNFGSDFDFFTDDNPQPIQFTPFTLYNTFWRDYVENNYSNETRRFSGKFYYTPLDVYETKLNDKVFIKDSYYRIEKINEADLVNNKLTDISLIKERGGYYKVIPPSPEYLITQGQGTYPVLVAPVPLVVSLSSSQETLCAGGGTSTTIYQYGGGAQLYEGSTVVTSIGGIGNIPYVPQGTYLKSPITNKIFVVINNYGQIIEDPC